MFSVLFVGKVFILNLSHFFLLYFDDYRKSTVKNLKFWYVQEWLELNFFGMVKIENPHYGRHGISRNMQKVAPTQNNKKKYSAYGQHSALSYVCD